MPTPRQVEHLKRIYEELLQAQKGHPDEELPTRLRVQARSTLQSLFGKDCHYLSEMEGFQGYASAWLKEMAGVVSAAIQDYEGGALQSYEATVVVDTLDDLLEQAIQANKGGEDGKKVAAVIVAAVFEDALSRICTRYGIQPPDSAEGKIQALKGKCVINAIQTRQLATIQSLRNSAFHAKWDEFSNADVSSCQRDLVALISTLSS